MNPGGVADIEAARDHVLPAAYPATQAMPILADPGFALLTERWTTLKHITLSPGRIGDLAAAAPVLVHFEHGRIT